MNDLERQLSYPLGEALPALGETIEVAPGVRWVRMNLPFVLNHINLWLLRDSLDGREGWSIVDCGVSTPETMSAWEQVFETQLEGLPVLRVLVTHMHPDHIGLANWICERWSTREHACRMWISATDYLAAEIAMEGNFQAGGPKVAAFFAQHGLNDQDSQEKVRSRSAHYAALVPTLAPSFRRLLPHMTLTIGGLEWTCLAGYGHAPEHMSFHCPALGVMIGGDMMLPRISTNISVTDREPEANALRLFLDSIEAYRKLPADTLVLPAHGKPFRGLHTRIDQLQQHHDDRLAEILQACAERPGSAADMLMVLFKRKLDLHQTTFAMGESIAHLNLLWHAGRMTRARGADEVYRFKTV